MNLDSLNPIPWFNKTSRRNQIIILAIVIGVIALVGPKLTASKTATPQYQTTQVTKGILVSTVTENGNVASDSQAGVGSPTNGVITDIFVKNGDVVGIGQSIFKVKSTASAQEIASAWASYQNSVNSVNSAKNSKMGAQATLEKDRQAVITASTAVTNMQDNLNTSTNNPATKQAYTQNDIDVINSALTSAKETFAMDEQKYLQSDQNIAAANAGLNSAWLAYQATQDSSVVAPIAGTVANIAYQIGDKVSASGGNLSSSVSNNSSSSSNPVMFIGNFTNPYINVVANEVDIVSIKPGQKATITLNAFPNQTFVGTVERVDTTGTISSGVVSYNVYVTLDSPVDTIKPGMSATVIIQTARANDVLYVPKAAVVTANGQATVRVLKNGQVISVTVTTGISSDSEIEITSGLNEGDTVVTSVSSTGTAGSSGTASPFGGGLRVGGFGGGAGGGATRTVIRGD